MKTVGLILALVALSAAVYTEPELTHCGGDGISVTKIEVNPMPIKFPGKLNVKVIADLTKDVVGPLEARVSLYSYSSWFGWVYFPFCISYIGSCTYSNLCTLLEPLKTQGCPAEMASRNIPCYCPFKPSHVDFDMAEMNLPSIPSALSALANGDYKAKAELYDNGVLVSCFEAKVSIES